MEFPKNLYSKEAIKLLFSELIDNICSVVVRILIKVFFGMGILEIDNL